MRRIFTPVALAAGLLLSGVSFDALMAPAIAQDELSINFDTFHDQLTPYGDWVYSDRWGEVWIPANVPEDFRPYDTNGYWANTDEYGWTWVSNYEWGDIPFHYGRWVNDPDDGWLWIPGYVWSPGWVAWRSNGQYTGWMPMPPDRQFLGYPASSGPSLGISFGGGIGISIDLNNTNDNYGYSQWYGSSYDSRRFADNWVFVGTGHMGDRDNDRRRYEAPRGNYETIIRNSRNTTNYTVVNNYIVNRSVDAHAVEKAGGHVQAVHVGDVIRKPQFIMRADQGQAVQTRMRDQRPRGTGVAGSAPKPSAQIVQSLSNKVPPHAGHPGAHLYTRDTVAKAPLVAKPSGPSNVTAPVNKMGTPATATPAAAPGGGMMGEHDKHAHTPPVTPTTTGPTTTGPGTTPPGNGERDRHMHTEPVTATPAATPPTTTGPTTTTTPVTRHRDIEMGRPTNPASTPATTVPATPPSETMHHPGAERVLPGSEPTTTTPGEVPPATGAPRMMGHHENPNAGPANPPNPAPTVVHTQPVVHTPPVVHTQPVVQAPPVVHTQPVTRTPPVVHAPPVTPAAPATPEQDKKHKHDDTKPQ